MFPIIPNNPHFLQWTVFIDVVVKLYTVIFVTGWMGKKREKIGEKMESCFVVNIYLTKQYPFTVKLKCAVAT